MTLFMPKTHAKQILPRNRLQRLALVKGFRSAYEFAKAVEVAGITSYGTAFSKWHSGRAENTQYNTLLAITKFLGAKSIEEVFDP